MSLTNTTSLTAATLFGYYTDQAKALEGLITDAHNRNIPEIIAFFSAQLIPQIIADINKVQNLQDSYKKQLLIDTVKYFITTVYSDLVAREEIQDDQINELIEASVVAATTPIIDMLIDVQNGVIVLTPLSKSFGQKLKTALTCQCCRKQA